MKELSTFEIALSRIKDGVHQFYGHIDGTFFAELDQQLIDQAKFEVVVTMEKSTDLVVLEISHKGYLETDCDRCLEPIQLPLEGQERIIIKFVEETRMDDEVTYLIKGTEKLDLAPFIFEVVSLSIPLVKKYDCELDQNSPCNKQVLAILNQEEKEKVDEGSPIWDELKKLNIKS
jgi:uncharacterized metal-binding protein YceD (DUF177 family)